MIELNSNELIFSFPEIRDQLQQRVYRWLDERVYRATNEERARLPESRERLQSSFDQCIPRIGTRVAFQRTLRIPDDGRDYPLPPSLGHFPVRHVDDFAGVPNSWKTRGGVMLPMHQTEALWLNFYASEYPIALKIGAGGICAISGERWAVTLQSTPQNYVVLPYQPWLDGFRINQDVVRQFVAMPLGQGLTVEQQLTGEETWGGLQFQAFPYRADEFWNHTLRGSLSSHWNALMSPPPEMRVCYSVCEGPREMPGAGLGAGGRMKQKIIKDPHGSTAWDTAQSSRCYAHLCLADDWQRITGTLPPQKPPTAVDYTAAGLPWFDYDVGQAGVEGATALSGVKTVSELAGKKLGLELPDNAPVAPANIVTYRPGSIRRVREF